MGVAIFIIVSFLPDISLADAFMPAKGKVKIQLENIKVVDARGDFPRGIPDNGQKNNIALKLKKYVYLEFGVKENWSCGFEMLYRKISTLYVRPLPQKNPNAREVVKQFSYDSQRHLQCNDEKIYGSGANRYKITYYTQSYYENEVFLKKKIYERNNSLIVFSLALIFQGREATRRRGVMVA